MRDDDFHLERIILIDSYREGDIVEVRLRIPTIVTAHTDERDRCSVRASVVFRV